jgi:hypothetical protein
VTARIHYTDIDELRHLAARDGHTVSSLIAVMVHDGLREIRVPVQHSVAAESA